MFVEDTNLLLEDYVLVEKAVNFLQENFNRQPSLAEVAQSVNLSEFHFQRLFSRWVGISPKRFLQYLTKEYARQLLADSRDLLRVSYEAGLSGPGRLHDLFITCEAVTPGEYKRKGAGLDIVYGFHPTPFGECLLASSWRGICSLAFIQDGERQKALDQLRTRYPNARFAEDSPGTRALAGRIFINSDGNDKSPLSLYLSGTNFQIKVWEALLAIPAGSIVTYEDIAILIGFPKAARAVGNAVSQNPLPFIIPCHRVIHKAGDFGNYQAGKARKMAILGWEMSKADQYKQRNIAEVNPWING
ncbi:MAG: bifunctional helix-turn-helix domain-containing protein/methylated-DNA--[protein]-cysteine S-methyltransferase [Omnitrophica WOR_2 bacterium]